MNDDKEKYIEIPYQELSDEVLQGIIRDFVLQEGTEYGAEDHSLDSKMSAVMRQVTKGQAKIFFDSESEACFLTLQVI